MGTSWGGARTNKIKHLDAVAMVMDLRVKGVNINEIAKQMGIKRRRALDLTIKGLSLSIIEDADQIKVQQLSRIDALQASLWDKALKGNFGAVDRIIELMKLRNKTAGIGEQQGGSTTVQTLVLLDDNGRNPVIETTARTVPLLEKPR